MQVIALAQRYDEAHAAAIAALSTEISGESN